MECWRNYVARFSSLFVSGVILSACYAPIVTPTQPEVVTELVASEVLKTEVHTFESIVTDTPTATQTPTPTFTPRPPPVEVDMETLELMASEWPGTDLYSVEQITFGDLLSISSKVYSGAGGSEATVEDGLLSHLAHQGVFAEDKYPEMDEIIQGPVEAYINTKLDLTSFADRISAPEPTVTPSPAPEGYVVQFYYGVPKEAVRPNFCGGYTIWTMDHDPREGYARTFWQANPGIPGPGYTYRTRDKRRNLDVCIKPGYPIVFQMDEGRITQNRYYDLEKGDVVIDIYITEGPGYGLQLSYVHINADTNPDTSEIEYLPVGTIVKRGDIIGYTTSLQVRPETLLNLGIMRGITYLPDQEMMLIGPDGQLNFIRP